ncbi:activator of basal transcription 1-like [Tigriopus californicus]|uniref:activator of basal transcription 1-like n=1 Tax=Tigriopus californicus TaxID=6832 RepID=UPI0027D9E83D|nr:activator of basal transcription 1-like [Tigriopus californicus]
MEDSSQEDDDIEDEDAPSMEESVPVSAHTSPPLRVSGRTSEQRPVRKKKPGIIYLSSIPPGFNVTRTTEFFSAMGKIGRVFLQPDKNERHHAKDHVALRFTEGWIEFMSKRVAKDVAENVNCTPVGGKKRSQSHEVLWNIKYLPRFKWSHLTERLNYEKATHHQKMRTEIARAKKESDFFKRKVEMSTKRKYSKRPKLAASNDDNFLPYET